MSELLSSQPARKLKRVYSAEQKLEFFRRAAAAGLDGVEEDRAEAHAPTRAASPVRRRRRYNSFRGEVGKAAENVLNREFEAETKHTKWATDVTEFAAGTAGVYVSPVLDLHDNRIVSVMAAPSPSAKMVTDGLRAAISGLGPDERPLVYSDQGFQYRHLFWQKTLRDAGLTQSMSCKGACVDNACMQGFFSHLKEEWFRIQQPATIEEFHKGLNEYLQWWNSTRIQQLLGYLSLNEYLARSSLPRNVQCRSPIFGNHSADARVPL